MARFVSQKNNVSVSALKRRPIGAVVLRHGGHEDVRFVRVYGGWRRERMDVTSERQQVVTSAAVASECNSAVGCKSSWARVY